MATSIIKLLFSRFLNLNKLHKKWPNDNLVTLAYVCICYMLMKDFIKKDEMCMLAMNQFYCRLLTLECHVISLIVTITSH